MGYNCKNGDFNAMANYIEQLGKNSSLRFCMGKNARKCAEEKFDRQNTYYQIEYLL